MAKCSHCGEEVEFGEWIFRPQGPTSFFEMLRTRSGECVKCNVLIVETVARQKPLEFISITITV